MRSFGRDPAHKPNCPFCGLPIERPKELKTRRQGEMPVGSCSCGAVYAYDATGHNLGAAFIEALVFSCNMDWDLAWMLLPEEDYQENLVENYDYETHLIVPGGFYDGRKVAGTLYFVKLHPDIQEVTYRGVQKRLERTASDATGSSAKPAKEKPFTKKEVEELVRGYRVEPILHIAGQDKRVIRDLQRLLYMGEELLRLRTADILGRVSALIARRDPGAISKLIQNLYNSNSDYGAFNWGALDAIGEIIANSPETFAGYIPPLYQYLGDRTLKTRALRALARIARANPDLIRRSSFRFLPILHDPEPEARAYAALILGCLGAGVAREDLQRLCTDEGQIALYENGRLRETTVGQVASQALEKI